MEYLETEKRKIHPRDRCNILSKLFFFYTLGLYRKGFGKELVETDLHEVPQQLRSQKLNNRAEKEWEKQKSKHKSISIISLFIRLFAKEYLVMGILQLIVDVAETTVPPYALGKFVSYFTSGQTDLTIYDAYCYAFILIGFYFIQRIFKHNYVLFILGLGIRIRTSFCSLLYAKVLRLNTSYLEDFSIGKIITMFTKDADAFEASLDFANDLWIGFIKIIVVSFIFYKRLGMTAVAGIATFFISIPLQIYLGVKLTSLKTKMYRKTDKRLQITQETLSAAKIIKMYAWEKIANNKIHCARKHEMKAMYQARLLRRFIMIIGTLNSYLAFYMLMMSLVWFGNDITAETVYFVSATFENLSFGLSFLFPNGICQFSELASAIKRYETILNAEELESRRTESDPSVSPKISLSNISVTIKDKNIIQNLNLVLEKGLTILTGNVGSGKSSLLKTILQEYKLDEGKVTVDGDISYASQEPWLFPSTIRQNILFGQKYEEKRYKKIVEICALAYDFKFLEEGDGTIVEDRGINLSKGQQLRINLARAIYKDSLIYLLDDPFAALDSQVGNYIFQECIKDFLKNKIIILTTHNSNYINDAQNVVTMTNKTSKITHLTPHKAEYLEKTKENKYKKIEKYDKSDEEDISNETSNLIGETKILRKVYKENQKTGAVGKKMYQQYIRFGGGYVALFGVFIVFILAQFSTRYTDKLISNWVNIEEKLSNYTTNQSYAGELYNELKSKRSTILYLYNGMTTLTVVTTFGAAIAVLHFTTKASLNLHKKCITSIINASMKFFDKNFIGNILNRLSKDLMEVDEFFPFGIQTIFEVVLALIGTIILIISVNPVFLLHTAVFFTLLVIIRRVCSPTVRNLKRLDSLTRSPLIGHINATVEGLTTIRAFQTQNILTEEFHNHHNRYNTAIYTFYCTLQAFAFIVDCLCVLLIGLVVVGFLISSSVAGDVGLALTQTLTMTRMLQWGIRAWIDLENRMTMIERVFEYNDAEQENKKGLEISNWPKHGQIRYENVFLSYSNSQEFTLSDINFDIRPNEKVGIVGRTGAGKSSLISSLFRLYDFKGKITIDDEDTKTLSLDLLRSKISIIPQDPVLFSGTVRENIDPANKLTDQEIWSVIETSHLKEIIPSLEHNIENAGTNFSIGQKQLICLARALVLKNKIIIFDEATATLDSETEKLIIETIRKNFSSCTVITIAHKLKTVLQCDRIMVLNEGKIIEYKETSDLLKNKNSYFYQMVHKHGMTQ